MTRLAYILFAWLFILLSFVGLIATDLNWLAFWGICAVTVSNFSRRC